MILRRGGDLDKGKECWSMRWNGVGTVRAMRVAWRDVTATRRIVEAIRRRTLGQWAGEPVDYGATNGIDLERTPPPRI